MQHQGIVTNGVIVPPAGLHLPEGAVVTFQLDEESDDLDGPEILPDPSLPPDHPHAPYNREVELAILRESIAEMKAGGGRPWREVLEELSQKHGLGPLPPE